MSSRPIFALAAASLLAALLAGCGGGSPSSDSATAPLVHLPADQAAHPAAHDEWWYVVGHLRGAGRSFGYETTVFKLHRVRLPDFSSPISLYRTDLAITDENGKRFYHRISYYFPQSASVSNRTLNVDVGNARLSGPSPAAMALHAAFASGAIDLHLSSKKPAMDVGGRGYLSFADGYTYYYSLTDLASRGTITLLGQRYRVTGISWLDHQWGSWSWSAVKGWTWMALQLANGVQLSVFDFRSAAGRVRGVSLLMKDGRLRTVRDISFQPLGVWASPHTAGRYPSGFAVRIPSLRAVLTVTPTVKDQEMTVPGQPAGSYWEGSSRVSGRYEGRPVTGLAYTELTGYAAR